MRSTNPVFSSLEKRTAIYGTDVATRTGIGLKTLFLVLVTLVSGYVTIFIPSNVLIIALVLSGIIGFISVLVSNISPRLAMPFSIIYSVAQGMAYGTLTWILEAIIPGVALTAMVGTAIVFIVMLMLYYTGLLRGSRLLYNIVISSLITLLIGSLVISIISLVNPVFATAFSQNVELAVGLGIFMVVLGAFMLTLDFERANAVVNMGLEKSAEWQVALGFMVTLIWIYYNILRLAVIFLSRNRN